MIYLVVFLLAFVGVLIVLFAAARLLICDPILRAARQLDTIIHQGVACSRCGANLIGDPRGYERSDEIFVEVRSKDGSHKFAVGAHSKDAYDQKPVAEDEITRLRKVG